MTKVSCSVEERYVNPLFEVFEGGDFILSSWRDIEAPLAEMRIYFEDAAQTDAAKKALGDALAIVGVETELRVEDVPDEDWKFAYRRHFKTEPIGERLVTVPTWEAETLAPDDWPGRERIVLDPGMAFGTGKHETTRACLEYIDELSRQTTSNSSLLTSRSFLDMGSGSGILSIAAAKLGFTEVAGFDVDPEAVAASEENAAANGVKVRYEKFALGRAANGEASPFEPADLVAANILGPLLIRFADEIVGYAKDRLIVSGILNELYPEVLAAYVGRGFSEASRKTIGEWTTGLLVRNR